MKRTLSITLLVATLLSLLTFHTQAATVTDVNEDIIYLEDGSYITVELTWTESRASGTKTGTKTYTLKTNAGEELWRAVLRGTFTYTGSSATCTASSCDVTISDSAWYVVSKTASKSGNAAVADLTMGKKFLGITIDKESISMRITCDANGNLS